MEEPSSLNSSDGLLEQTRQFSIEKEPFNGNCIACVSEVNLTSHSKAKKRILADLSLDFFRLLSSAIQISLGYICLSFILSINLYFLGRKDRIELVSAVGLGNVWINFTSMHLVYGLNSGFEVIASQAFGSKRLKYFRELKMKAATIIAGLLLISFGLCFCVRPVFISFGYDPQIVELMSQYVLYSFPSIIFQAFFDLEVESLNCQGTFSIQFFIVLFTASMHVLWCYVFVNILGLEIEGVSFALIITNFSNLALIKITKFFLKSDRTKSVTIPYSSILHMEKSAWVKYMSQVLPIASSVFFDIFALETITFIAGGMSSNVLITVHVLYVNIESFFYNFSEGYGAAIYSYVGANLGSGNLGRAKRWAKLGVFGCISIVGIVSSLFIVFSRFFSGLLSENSEVNDAFEKYVYLFVGYLFLNSIFTSCKAVIMIIGHSRRMVILTLVFAYVIQLPLIGVLTISLDFGLYGIWGTMMGCVIGEIIIEQIWICRLRWRRTSFEEDDLLQDDISKLEKTNRKKVLLSAL